MRRSTSERAKETNHCGVSFPTRARDTSVESAISVTSSDRCRVSTIENCNRARMRWWWERDGLLTRSISSHNNEEHILPIRSGGYVDMAVELGEAVTNESSTSSGFARASSGMMLAVGVNVSSAHSIVDRFVSATSDTVKPGAPDRSERFPLAPLCSTKTWTSLMKLLKIERTPSMQRCPIIADAAADVYMGDDVTTPRTRLTRPTSMNDCEGISRST